MNLTNKRLQKAIVFLGGGRITSALAAGLRVSGYNWPLVVYDRNPEKMRSLRRDSQIEIARNLRSAIRQAEILVIAVRPASVAPLFDEIAAAEIALPRLCISLAAGIPLRSLRAITTPAVCWVRAMPSPVSRIAKGLTALSFGSNCTTPDRRTVRDLFVLVGKVIEIPEKAFDAFTVTYSSSHGYHALAVLAQAAHHAGLDPKNALLAAAHALGDGILYWRESGESLDDLLSEAATPGGIAAATMAAMDKAGYAKAVRNGLKAGMQRAQKNSKL